MTKLRTLQQRSAHLSSLQAILSRKQAKNARLTELIGELQSLGVTQVDDGIDRASRKMHKDTALLAHKVRAAQETDGGISTADLWVVLTRMEAVLASSERTADETIAALEQELVSRRGASGKKPS